MGLISRVSSRTYRKIKKTCQNMNQNQPKSSILKPRKNINSCPPGSSYQNSINNMNNHIYYTPNIGTINNNQLSIQCENNHNFIPDNNIQYSHTFIGCHNNHHNEFENNKRYRLANYQSQDDENIDPRQNYNFYQPPSYPIINQYSAQGPPYLLTMDQNMNQYISNDTPLIESHNNTGETFTKIEKNKKDPKIKSCNCAKTLCLKLYCDCFARGELCTEH